MSDTEAPAAPAAVTPPKKATKKAPKVAKTAEHPKYSEMVATAISTLKERKGSSVQAIKKFISTTYKIDEKAVSTHVRSALKRGLSSGQLTQVKGTGASGSFKLAEAAKPKKETKSPNKAAKETKSPKKAAAKVAKSPKKPAAAKKTATKSPKKAVKKTATKKTPTKSTKKVAKSPAKKPVAKKAAKKTVAKK